jgi:hypothetical protein
MVSLFHMNRLINKFNNLSNHSNCTHRSQFRFYHRGLPTFSTQVLTLQRVVTFLIPINSPSVLSRSMWSRTSRPRILNYLSSTPERIPSTVYFRRGYPGHGYRGRDHIKSLNSSGKQETDVRLPNNTYPPQHECTHTGILDNETNQVVGILSSCKNPQKGFKKIADENYKHQTVGTSNSDPNKLKPQYMKTYHTPRVYDEETTTENVAATTFLKKYEKEVDVIVNQMNSTVPPVYRVNKSSSNLYHENGQPIFDADGHEIDYE